MSDIHGVMDESRTGLEYDVSPLSVAGQTNVKESKKERILISKCDNPSP